MRRPTRLAALAVGLLLVGLGVVLALQDSGPRQTGGRLLGKPLPAFDLPTIEGGRIRRDDVAGKTVVVNFWNSWCIPCEQEYPALLEFYERHRDEADFVMIGIVRDDTEEAARANLVEEPMPWVIALDPGDRAALDFGTTGQPETYVAGPDGIVAEVQLGPSSVELLEAMLASARTVRP